MDNRQSFTFYRSFYEAISALEACDREAIFMAICAYALNGEERALTGVPAAIFLLIKPNLDASKRKAESGKQGGSVEANNKQITSKAEAKGKQTVSKAQANKKQSASNKELGIRSKELGVRKKENECTPQSPPDNEPKVQWADNVFMTNAQHDKLLSTHGAADTARLIEILDNYKGSTGKAYKDDYRAILSWCLDRLHEEKKKGTQTGSSSNVFLEMLREEGSDS